MMSTEDWIELIEELRDCGYVCDDDTASTLLLRAADEIEGLLENKGVHIDRKQPEP